MSVHIILSLVCVAEWPPFGKELLSRLTIRSLCILIFVILVISRFCFEERIWVLMLQFLVFAYVLLSFYITLAASFQYEFQFILINQNMPSELSHPYHLDESILMLCGISSNLSFSFHFSMKVLSADRKAPDGTPLFAYVA